MQLRWFIVWIGIFLVTPQSMAKGVEVSKKIDFDIGQKSVTLHGAVRGFEKTNYQFYANKGETLHVNIDSSKAYFKIYSPFKNSSDFAFFIGDIEGSKYKDKLLKRGIYTIQVYLIYEEAKKDIKSLYTMHINID